MYELLKRLPGYTAETLLAEDAELVEDFLSYMAAENWVAREKARVQAEAQKSRSGRNA